MAEPARTRDRIEVGRRFTAEDAARFERRFYGVSPPLLLADLMAEFRGRIAVVSSFGAESAVLLNLVAKQDPAVPVLFIDTGHLFAETLAYRDTLIERLGLSDVRTIRPDSPRLDARDPAGERWTYDPDGCCDIRKVQPLTATLTGFDAWISGRKGFQAETRAALPRFEAEDGKLKINPLADWSKTALDAHIEANGLPRHPLEAQGYPSIGCAPCTSPVRPGEDARAGRWRGMGKVECGIHSTANR